MGLLQQKKLIEKATAQKGSKSLLLEEAQTSKKGWKRPPDAPPPHTRSGNETVSLGTLGPGKRVTKASMKVSGEAFRGKVASFSGTQVTASPVVYGTSGLPLPDSASSAAAADGQQGFIVDFGGMRSLLAVGFDSRAITMVLPWMGTAFSERPLFPVPTTSSSAPPPAAAAPTLPATATALADFPGVDTQKVFVQIMSADELTAEEFSNRCSVRTTTVPSNVRASIGDRLPFWTNPGPLTDEVDVTGLLEDLNAALADMEEPGPMSVEIATDTPGVINVAFSAPTDLKVSAEASARWGGGAELDVEVKALAPVTATVVWPVPENARPWLLDELLLDVAPAFPPWRAFPVQAVNAPGGLGLRVSGQFSVARHVAFSEEVLAYGVALPVRSSGDAEIAVELTPGDVTAPATAAPLATAAFKAVSASDPEWVEVLFEPPVTVPAGDFWVVAKSRQGTIEWVGTPAAGSGDETKFSDQGARFEAYPRLGADEVDAQLRILRAPLPAENASVLDVTVPASTLPTQDVVAGDPALLTYVFSTPRELVPDPAGVALDVEVGARSSGTVTLRGATAIYREKAT